MPGVNRYKYVALEIVQRWQSGMEYLLDPHVNMDMLTRGCLLAVVGAPHTGKTLISMRMAKWLHERGTRAPALIDEDIFRQHIDIPPRGKFPEWNPNSQSPWLKIRDWAQRTHTVAIVNVTLNRSFRVPRLQAIAGHEDDMLALAQHRAAVANHSLTHFCDSIWLMRRQEGKIVGGVLKSRTGCANSSPEVVIHGAPFTMQELADNPYFKRGVEAAVWIKQRYYG